MLLRVAGVGCRRCSPWPRSPESAAPEAAVSGAERFQTRLDHASPATVLGHGRVPTDADVTAGVVTQTPHRDGRALRRRTPPHGEPPSSTALRRPACEERDVADAAGLGRPGRRPRTAAPSRATRRGTSRSRRPRDRASRRSPGSDAAVEAGAERGLRADADRSRISGDARAPGTPGGASPTRARRRSGRRERGRRLPRRTRRHGRRAAASVAPPIRRAAGDGREPAAESTPIAPARSSSAGSTSRRT